MTKSISLKVRNEEWSATFTGIENSVVTFYRSGMKDLFAAQFVGELNNQVAHDYISAFISGREAGEKNGYAKKEAEIKKALCLS